MARPGEDEIVIQYKQGETTKADAVAHLSGSSQKPSSVHVLDEEHIVLKVPGAKVKFQVYRILERTDRRTAIELRVKKIIAFDAR